MYLQFQAFYHKSMTLTFLRAPEGPGKGCEAELHRPSSGIDCDPPSPSAGRTALVDCSLDTTIKPNQTWYIYGVRLLQCTVL